MSEPSRLWPYISTIGKLLNIPGTSIGPGILIELQNALSDDKHKRELLDALVEIKTNTAATTALLAKQGVETTDERLSEAAGEIAESIYRQDIANDYRYADFKGIAQTKKIVSLEIDDLFVDLKIRRATDGTWRHDPDGAFDEERAFSGKTPLKVEKEDRSEVAKLTPPVRFDALLASPGLTVLLGGPGSGKTTVVKRIARLSALGGDRQRSRLPFAPESLFPIVLPLTAYASDGNGADLLSFVRARLRATWGSALEQVFDEHWALGQCVLLLDGLDEIAHLGDRIACARAIDDFVPSIDRNRVVVTSRLVGYATCALSTQSSYATLQPFEPSDIDHFIRQWHRAFERSMRPAAPQLAVADAEAKDLIDNIRRSERVQALASNPLMLTIISLIKHQNVRLPERRVQLYEVIMETMLTSWSMARGLSRDAGSSRPESGSDGSRKLWAAVAYWMHETQNRTVAKRLLHEKLAEILFQMGKTEIEAEGEAAEYVRTASEQSGFIEERGADQFAFMHQSFQEYLAAQHLVLMKPASKGPDRVIERADDPRWHEVVRLAVGFIGVVQKNDGGATELVERMRTSTNPLEPFIRGGLRLATACIADDVGVEQESADRAIADLCDSLAKCEDKALFAELIEAMRSVRVLAPRESIEALIELSSAQDWHLRVEAARMLGRVTRKSSDALQACKKLLHDKDEDVRSHAAVGVWHVDRSIEARCGLIAYLAGGYLGLNAIESVASNPDFVDSAVAMLSSANVDARSAAIYVIGEWGPRPDGLTPLIALLNDQEATLRSAAASALGKWGPQQEALAPLVALLKDANPGVRSSAANALGQWGPQQEALAPLVALLKDANPGVRSSAASALGKWGPQQEALAPLVALLKDANPGVRDTAASALGKWGPQQEALAPLVALLKDASSDVRDTAAGALGQWGPQQEALAP
ncbi:MAG: HEAT repeat domain-containing protein, partial [Vicinamibacteria bacterium]|nr:HEAT repeat domain-containing protein [Vicinamibacteria bacterium]